jgi:hypothetical protein
LITVAALAMAAALVLPVLAQADTTNIIEPNESPPTAENGFQAITCTEDEPSPGVKCSPETPEIFYTQAAGHPPVGFTQYIIRHGEVNGGPFGTLKPIEPPEEDRTIKTLRVDLPPGLTVNPEATPRCPIASFETKVENPPGSGEFVHAPQCDPASQVGVEEVTLVVNTPGAVPSGVPGVFLPVGTVVPPNPALGTKVPVYNLQPKPGEPALFGFVVAGKEVVFLETEVAWQSDFHESFTIRLPDREPPFSTLMSRLVNFGRSGDGTYLTTPTTCFDPAEWTNLYTTWFRAESYGEPNPNFPNGSTPVPSTLEESEGNLVRPTGCGAVPFDPGVTVDPGTAAVDSPAHATVDTTLKYYTGAESEIEESHLKSAEVSLPAGMALNPSGANGLVACTDAQFTKGIRDYDNACPANSKIGTAEIETPPLPAGSLKGDVYVGQQQSTDPTSGNMFRILVEAKSEERGVDVRLVGNVRANQVSGQLTAVLDEQETGELAGKLPQGLPQVPFTSVKLRFGNKDVLTSPQTCSPATTVGKMEPWARPGTRTRVTHSFTLSTLPGGGACPKTLGERPFAPGYDAKSDSRVAGKYSPFRVTIARPDGQQDLVGVDVTLPEGLTGKLAGIPYCSDQALAAAAAKPGAAEKVSPSCGAASRIGSATTTAGTGPSPLTIGGTAYLAGPYRGAPLSMAVITPAVAGPFDLGTVVIRVALWVNPETAQVRAISEPIPDVFGGVKLDIRRVAVDLDRHEFMLNPTSCDALAVSGFLIGSGSNPNAPSAFSSYPFSVPYQTVKCKKLGFKPKLFTRLYGGKKATRRNGHPKLRAVLVARKGDANIARTALTLPHSELLDQAHIKTICTRVQLAAQKCPKKAIYGNAKAVTPLLDKPLKGHVYLVSSSHKLPDLLADLHGQINVQLHGVISSRHGGIKTVFKPVPDVPVKKFLLWMKGGGRGLLVNSRDLCIKRSFSRLNIKAHNGKKVKKKNLPLKFKACGNYGHGKKKHHHKGGRG